MSRALNRPELVGEALRQRVLVAASELGYVADRAGRALAGGRSGLLGVLAPAAMLASRATLIAALVDRVAKAGRGLLLDTPTSPDHEAECARRLVAWGVEAIALVGCGGETTRHVLERAAVAGVLCDRTGSGWPSIRCDWRSAGETLARYLLGLGHRRWAMVMRGAPTEHDSEVLTGLRDALPPGALAPTILSIEEHFPPTWRRSRTDPTAYLCSDGMIAARVRERLVSGGTRIHEEAAIVALDEAGEPGGSAITSLRPPLSDLGRRTADYLLGGPDVRALDLVLPVKLVLRATTGPRASVE